MLSARGTPPSSHHASALHSPAELHVLRAAPAVQDTDRDFFMGAEEAVEYGLIDAVISRPQLIAATNGASP